MSRRTQLHRDALGIVTNEKVMSGDPCFDGTRIPVETVLSCLDYGWTDKQVCDGWPELTPADIEQARLWRNTEGAVQP